MISHRVAYVTANIKIILAIVKIKSLVTVKRMKLLLHFYMRVCIFRTTHKVIIPDPCSVPHLASLKSRAHSGLIAIRAF